MDDLSVDGKGTMPMPMSVSVSIEKRTSNGSSVSRPRTAPNLDSYSTFSELTHNTSVQKSVRSRPNRSKPVNHTAIYKLDPEVDGTIYETTQEDLTPCPGESGSRHTGTFSQMRPRTAVQRNVQKSFRGPIKTRLRNSARSRPQSVRTGAVESNRKTQQGHYGRFNSTAVHHVPSVRSIAHQDSEKMNDMNAVFNQYMNSSDVVGVGEAGLEGEPVDPNCFDEVAPDGANHMSQENLEKINEEIPKSISISSPIDSNNVNFHHSRRIAYSGLSERDQGALRIGRLVISTVLNQPEVSVPDSISRFFTDLWLSKNGSTVGKADSASISLMSSLQRSITEYDPGEDPTAPQTASCQKSVAAIACEALDVLIAVFGQANPVLADIRAALLPVIFFHPPPLSYTPEHDSNTSESAHIKPLTGRTYMELSTWCEDAAYIIQDLRETEHALNGERQAHAKTKDDLEYYKRKYEEVECEKGESQNKLLSMQRENDSLKDKYKDLESMYTELLESNNKLKASYSADSEKFRKEGIANMQLTAKCEEYETKFCQANSQKRNLEEEKEANLRELKILKSKLKDVETQLSVLTTAVKDVSQTLETTRQNLKDAEHYRTTQKAKCRKALQRIQNEMADRDAAVPLSVELKNMMRASDPDIIGILERRISELTLSNKEMSLRLVDTSFDDMLKSRLEAREKLHQEEVKSLIRSRKNEVEAIKKQKDVEIEELKTSTDALRRDLLESQIDMNGMDSQLQEAKDKIHDLERQRDTILFELERKSVSTNTTKLCLQDRLDMLAEDHLTEILLRKSKVLIAEQTDSIALLRQDSVGLHDEINELKVKLSDVYSELSAVTTELNETRLTLSQSREEVLFLERKVDDLNQHCDHKIQLEEENSRLKMELVKLERDIIDSKPAMESESLSMSRNQQALDTACMDYESYIGHLLRDQHLSEASYERKLDNIASACDESNQLYAEVLTTLETSESEIMKREEERTRAAYMMISINKSFSPTVSFNESDPAVDPFEGDHQLQNEIAAHKKTKEKYKAMLSSEMMKSASMTAINDELSLRCDKLESELLAAQKDRDDAQEQLRLSVDVMLQLEENACMLASDHEAVLLNRMAKKADRAMNTDPMPPSLLLVDSNRRDEDDAESVESTTTRSSAVSQVYMKSKTTDDSSVSKVASKGQHHKNSSMKYSSKAQRNVVSGKRDLLKSNKKSDKHEQSTVDAEIHGVDELHSTVSSQVESIAEETDKVKGDDTKYETLSHFELKQLKLKENKIQMSQRKGSGSSLESHDLNSPHHSQQSQRRPVENEQSLDLASHISLCDSVSAESNDTREISQKENTADVGRNGTIETTVDSKVRSVSNVESKTGDKSISVVDGARLMAEDMKTQNIFDASVASKSSHDYFFEILEKRERRNIFENQRLRMMIREAAGLVNRLEDHFSRLSAAIHQSPERITSALSQIVDEVRLEFSDNKWVFSVKPEHLIEDQVLKDAIFVGGAMRSAASYADDLINLDHMKSAISSETVQKSLDDMTHKVRNLKNDAEKRARHGRSSYGKGGWKSVLFRLDGTVDSNMSLSGWSRKERNEIYAEMVSGLVKEKEEKEKLLYHEIKVLKDAIAECESKIQEQKSLEGHLLRQIDDCKANTVELSEYHTLAAYVSDVIMFINLLTTTDPNHGSVVEDLQHERNHVVLGKDITVQCPSKEDTSRKEQILTAALDSPSFKSALKENSTRTGVKSKLLPPSIAELGTGKHHIYKTLSGCVQGHTPGQGGGGYGDAPSSSNIYGNPGILWRKILHRNRAEKALNHVKSSSKKYGIVDSEDMLKSSPCDIHSHSPSIQPAHRAHSVPVVEFQDSMCSEYSSQTDVSSNALIHSLSIACDSLAEKILFPAGIDINCPGKYSVAQESGGILVHDGTTLTRGSALDAGNSVNEMSLSLSQDVLQRSVKLNAEINAHHAAIKRLRWKQSSILNHNLDTLSIEAERYYAGSLRTAHAPDTITKWGAAFVKGSGSKFVQNLLGRCRPMNDDKTDVPTTGMNNDDEFPVIRKQYIGARPIKSNITSKTTEVCEDRSERPQFLGMPDFRKKSAPSTAQIPYFTRRTTPKNT